MRNRAFIDNWYKQSRLTASDYAAILTLPTNARASFTLLEAGKAAAIALQAKRIDKDTWDIQSAK